MTTSWPPPRHAPLPPPPPPPPFSVPRPTREPLGSLPVGSACVALGATVALLVLNRVVIRSLADEDWPVVAYIALSALIAYGPLVLLVLVICRRHGSGDLGRDIGLTWRAADLGWGPLTWVATFAGQIVIGAVILLTRLPFTSNAGGIEAGRDDRGFVIAMVVLAVGVAPVVEELVFRGVVVRGLASRLPVAVAVAVQGIAFGAVHADPSYGWGNLGLVLALGVTGVVLGGSAVLVRRIGPAMIAHAMVNAIALTAALTGLADT